MRINNVSQLYNQTLADFKYPMSQLRNKYEKQGMDPGAAKDAARAEFQNLPQAEKEEFIRKSREVAEKAKKHCINEIKAIFKANYKSNTALYKNLNGYNYEEGVELPELHYTDREHKDRKALSEIACEKYVELVVSHFANNSYSAIDNDYSNSGRGAIQFFPKPPFERPDLAEKLKEDIDLMASRDPKTLQARKDYFENRISRLLQTVEKVTHARSDEEYVKLMDQDTFSDLMVLGEMQWSYQKHFVKEFGLGEEIPDPDNPGKTKMNMFVELDSKLMEKWEEMAPIFVELSFFTNRLASISHPDYANMSVEDAKKINDFTVDNFSENQYDKIGYAGEAMYNDKYKTMSTQKRNPKKYVSGEAYAGAAGVLSSSEMKKAQKSLLQYDLKSKYKLDPQKSQFRTIDGNPISMDEAISNMFAQKTVDLYDQNGKFLQRYERGSSDRHFSGIKTAEKYTLIDYVHGDPNTLKTTFSDFAKLADEGTHWYIHSSQQYRDFRTALKELNEHDMKDPAKTEELMNRVAQTASDYMKFKEQPGTEFSKNTDDRYKAAQMISARMKFAVSELHKTLEAENASKVQEQQMPGGQGGNNVQQPEGPMIINELGPQNDPMLNPQLGQENIPQVPANEQVQQQGEKIEAQEEQKAVS